MPLSFKQFSALLAGLSFTTLAFTDGNNVFITRFWHNHQPIYWPEWNTNGSETSRIEYAWDSIVLKGGRSYNGSTATGTQNFYQVEWVQ